MKTELSRKDRGQVLRVRGEGRFQLRQQLLARGVPTASIHKRIVAYNVATKDLALNDLYLYARDCLQGEYLAIFKKRIRECFLEEFSHSESDSEQCACEPASSSRPEP